MSGEQRHIEKSIMACHVTPPTREIILGDQEGDEQSPITHMRTYARSHGHTNRLKTE